MLSATVFHFTAGLYKCLCQGGMGGGQTSVLVMRMCVETALHVQNTRFKSS